MRICALAFMLICALLSGPTTPAQARCAPGYGACPSGGCAPLGSTCCANGKYAPAGRFCCSDGTNCPNGTICSKPGSDECIPKTSARVCGDGRSYCEPGYRCGDNNRCHEIATVSPPPSGGRHGGSSGGGDARHCLTVLNVDKADYKVVNTCSYKVNFVLQTMEFHPKQTTTDSLYVEGNDTEDFITSYHGYRPVVISATRD